MSAAPLDRSTAEAARLRDDVERLRQRVAPGPASLEEKRALAKAELADAQYLLERLEWVQSQLSAALFDEANRDHPELDARRRLRDAFAAHLSTLESVTHAQAEAHALLTELSAWNDGTTATQQLPPNPLEIHRRACSELWHQLNLPRTLDFDSAVALPVGAVHLLASPDCDEVMRDDAQRNALLHQLAWLRARSLVLGFGAKAKRFRAFFAACVPRSAHLQRRVGAWVAAFVLVVFGGGAWVVARLVTRALEHREAGARAEAVASRDQQCADAVAALEAHRAPPALTHPNDQGHTAWMTAGEATTEQLGEDPSLLPCRGTPSEAKVEQLWLARLQAAPKLWAKASHVDGELALRLQRAGGLDAASQTALTARAAELAAKSVKGSTAVKVSAASLCSAATLLATMPPSCRLVR